MQALFWIFISYLKLDQFKCRCLTQAEIKLCQTVFGDLIDYSKVRIMNQPFLPWQPKGIFMAPLGSIHLHNADYCEDFSLQSLAYQAVFIHEMAHIYQYQQHINVLFKGAMLQTAYYMSAKKYNPYQYQFVQGKAFFKYNIEQQGDIAKDIFLKKIQNIIKK
ncbi:hypothetical protein EC844_102102 [Acinetobacter calcoaceticus]|uniref:Type IV secretion protein Rhs n=1 Tax=Acinetobacter calcoaceticus TaxID=471 RepID=A0A4R1Y4E6_ACICA|nr:hypothetical protein EC844_102102 [Acinetobacter calcoaceticus]